MAEESKNVEEEIKNAKTEFKRIDEILENHTIYSKLRLASTIIKDLSGLFGFFLGLSSIASIIYVYVNHLYLPAQTSSVMPDRSTQDEKYNSVFWERMSGKF